jgi:hypothetical protein
MRCGVRHAVLLLLVTVSVVSAQEPRVIRPGDPAIDVTRLKPGRWTMEMKMFRGEGDAGQTVGRSEMELIQLQREGKSALLLVQTTISPRGTMVDSATMWRDGLRPITHRSRGPRTLEIDFHAKSATGKIGPVDSVQSFTREWSELPFDAGAMDLVFQTLSLEPGYRARLPMYIHELGGVVWHDITVTGETEVEQNGAHVPAWKLKVASPTYAADYVLAKSDGAVLRVTVERQGTILRVTRK